MNYKYVLNLNADRSYLVWTKGLLILLAKYQVVAIRFGFAVFYFFSFLFRSQRDSLLMLKFHFIIDVCPFPVFH